MKKKFIVMLMMVFVTAAVFAGSSKVKTAFVKNSTGNTIVLIEQNDDGSYDWSTFTVVDKDCVAIKHSEKK